MDSELLAQVISEKARQDPKIEKIVMDSRHFDELKEQVGWQLLKEYVVSREATWMQDFAARLKRGDVVSQREIDYHRGFYDGAKYAVMIPEVAIANLMRVAQKAYALEMVESDDEEYSPYV